MKCKQFLSVVLALSMSLSNLIIPLSASAEDINDVTEFQNYDGITNDISIINPFFISR